MTSNSGMEVATLVHFSFLAYVDGNVMFGHLALNFMVKYVQNVESEAAVASTKAKKSKKKKRAASDAGDTIDTEHGAATDGVLVEYDVNEPTMGEKLASITLQDNGKTNSLEIEESPPHAKPPSADSVNILLKQALRADDRALLLDCLYTQDEKVIANSISLLNPSDVLKLLQSLLSIIHSRGAILACALPWLRSLLLQHSTGIMSQESSLHALNSLYQVKMRTSPWKDSDVETIRYWLSLNFKEDIRLFFTDGVLSSIYLVIIESRVPFKISMQIMVVNLKHVGFIQLIESRVSTFQSALQLSSYIDFLYAGVVDDASDENHTVTPVIYEDNDESDDEESEDAMETDQDSKEDQEASDGLSDIEGSDGMSE
ncbi:polyubiquitin 11-like isoform X3 [Populus alba x Populus x berolinensis]|uniref:Polyubiquitin 11-like isoform X3 n=1 Tax=Populus alba x Populus x berolinensis TaxID=444605 RepID=A0AAD6R7H3_9ROSI|nr:polyubiquitin 11-like isoform X3 [Populus alba x Populus x berolinensis]